MQLVI